VQSAYLLGQTRLGGWWYWYPVAALIKLPIPVLTFFALAFVLLPGAVRHSNAIFWASLCLLVPAAEVALAIAVSTGTGTNAAFRYLIPSIALCCVWAGRAAGGLVSPPSGESIRGRESTHRTSTLVLLIWLLLDAVTGLPDHLGWQNEMGWAWQHWSGQPALIGDSLDWGQDLIRLDAWVKRHSREGSTLICVYGFGAGDPYGLQPPAARPTSAPGDQATYLAVSEDVLHGYNAENSIQIGGGRSSLDYEHRAALLRYQPFGRIGRTVRIYRLSDISPAFKFTGGAVRP
jgi:hypothetical protein